MKVGFVGLGKMGGAIASRLQAAGHLLAVNDLNLEAGRLLLSRGAEWKESPAGVLAVSEVTFLSLPRPQDVEEVVWGDEGLIQGCSPGKTCVDLSTNSPDVVARVAVELSRRGVDFCDAPVSGGPKGAALGTLTVYVGGDTECVARCQLLFEEIGSCVLHVGPVGTGTIAKVVHNCAGFVVNSAIAEVFAVGVRAGVEPFALWKAIRNGSVGRRRTFDGMAAQYLSHSFEDPDFTLALAHKDVTLGAELGQKLGVPMPCTDLTRRDMSAALERGWGGLGSSAVLSIQSERAGVEIAVAHERIAEELSG